MAERVNPLSLIRAFGAWSDTNHLDPMAELLWYKLFQFFNRLGWPEWVQIDSLRLAAMVGIRREATMLVHRNALIDNGLLGYKKGKKGDPSRYSMKCPTLSVVHPVVNTVGESVVETVVETVGESVEETVDIYRLRQDTDISLRKEKAIYYNNAWKTDARAARAVAQNVLDSLSELCPDGYPYANNDICYYFSLGMTPEQVIEGLEYCKEMSYVRAHLHTHAVFLGLEDEIDEQ